MTRWPHLDEVLSRRTLVRVGAWWGAITLAFALVGPFLLRISWLFARESSAKIAFALSRDGQQLAFSGVDGELYLHRLSDGGATRLTKTPLPEISPSFSRDDRRLVFAAAAEDSASASLFELSLESSERRQITFDLDVFDNYPSYAPDGRDIVFSRAHRHRPYSMGGMIWDQWDVYLVKPDGTDLRRLTHEEYHTINAPTFSPDGRTVVFAGDSASGRSGITELDLAGEREGRADTVQERVLGPPNGMYPSYSPDGSQLVCISDERIRFHYDVIIMNRGSSVQSFRAPAVGRYNLSPKFAAGGAAVFFLSAEAWNSGNRPELGIWKADVQGKHAQQVIPNSVLKGAP